MVFVHSLLHRRLSRNLEGTSHHAIGRHKYKETAFYYLFDNSKIRFFEDFLPSFFFGMVLGTPASLITFVLVITRVDPIVEGVELELLPAMSKTALAPLWTPFRVKSQKLLLLPVRAGLAKYVMVIGIPS